MSTSSISVLIIDDCPEDRAIFRRYLEQSSQHVFHILETDSGVEGLEFCQTENPDCILLDYQIPDLDGLEFISSIVHDEHRQFIPVLMLTGQGDEFLAANSIKNGAWDYLVKSKLTSEGLIRAVTTCIEKASLIRKTEQQRMEIERSHQELEQFTHNASHDLQAPVRRIITFLELLQKELKGNLTERSQDYIDRTLKSAFHMRRLIKDLLEYSLVGGAQQPLHPVNLNDIVQEALTQLEVTIQGTQANITVQTLPTINGNETFLQQLFQNLISNALKFRSTKAPLVEISVCEIGANWLLKVRDNGVGIPSESFEKIFRVFQRLDNGMKTEGTGIGLALCKKIVELHGGRIWVESGEQTGTTFHFTFPRMNPSENATEQYTNAEGLASLPESSADSVEVS